MNTVDREVLETAIRWQSGSRAVFLVTVAKTWGSSPRPAGSMMVISEDGRFCGSVSGGCVEDDVLDRMRNGSLLLDRVDVVRYGQSTGEAGRVRLPCGGQLLLVIEPVSAQSRLVELKEAIQAGRRMTRTLDLDTGTVTLSAGFDAIGARLEGRQLSTSHGPRYRFIAIGAVEITRYATTIAQSLGYQVIVCDPRADYRMEWELPGVELTDEMPDDAILRLQPDVHTAIAALTHDAKLDDMALLEALKSPAFYVGALGSRLSHARRRERLAMFDLTKEEIDRLHGPIGLDLGARTPPEIALAILAEMTALRNGVPILQRHGFQRFSGDAVGCLSS